MPTAKSATKPEIAKRRKTVRQLLELGFFRVGLAGPLDLPRSLGFGLGLMLLGLPDLPLLVANAAPGTRPHSRTGRPLRYKPLPEGCMRLDPDAISEQLEKTAQRDVARKRGKHIKAFRGVRGVPVPEITQVLVKAWNPKLNLIEDGETLHTLFCTAHEDGLVAVGLLAAMVPDEPMASLEMVDRWVGMVDDTETADALGWMVLGPALLAAREPWLASLRTFRTEHAWGARRMAVMAGMALLPVPLQGMCAAALRERMGMTRLQFVAEADSPAIHELLHVFLRDEDPRVIKAFIRVARSWGESDPDACEAWLDTVRGGVAKRLRQELERGVKKGRRRVQREADAAAYDVEHGTGQDGTGPQDGPPGSFDPDLH
ncbi:MAG: hypothetical protein ACI9VR_005026 [Cognaticolwellia sp.]|jgi:hypothetical protein